ncbi:MAG TPA: carboxymuconolactone decarboxylase family protein [Methylocella sp.]|nr:carboxymuconolactone decarboxylase family protein [Methylocella sp.]
MRLALLAPADLSAEQRVLYDDMRKGIGESFGGFIAMREDGALIGPWNPWLHEPRIGKPIWELTKALSQHSNLPDAARQVAILVTGAHFRAAYEIYAHVPMAEKDRISDAKIATIIAGQRPPDLTRQEAIAYDVSAALTNGGVLPELTYRAAVDAFGIHGAAELCYLVGLYCLVSLTLNGFDVPVPEEAGAAK